MLVVNVHRDPTKHFALMEHIVLPTGKIMYSVEQAPVVAGAVAPKINPSTDFSGNWRYRFPGTPEEVRARILKGAGAPSTEGPYTPKAVAQIKLYKEDDNPTYRCLPISLPALLMTVYEYKWVRYPDRIVVLKEQYQDDDRTIWLNNARRPASYKPDQLGYSTGHFETDGTLVVETSGFSAQPWGNASGLDSSTQKRVVERYRLSNGGLGLELSRLRIGLRHRQPGRGLRACREGVDAHFQRPWLDAELPDAHGRAQGFGGRNFGLASGPVWQPVAHDACPCRGDQRHSGHGLEPAGACRWRRVARS